MDEVMEQYLKDMERRIIQETAHSTRVIMESSVGKQLQLLVEGQKTLLETLAPKNRVEALEDEVIFLKQVIRGMAQDIAELKKAQ